MKLASRGVFPSSQIALYTPFVDRFYAYSFSTNVFCRFASCFAWVVRCTPHTYLNKDLEIWIFPFENNANPPPRIEKKIWVDQSVPVATTRLSVVAPARDRFSFPFRRTQHVSFARHTMSIAGGCDRDDREDVMDNMFKCYGQEDDTVAKGVLDGKVRVLVVAWWKEYP